MSLSAAPFVLVTGASGFIAQHCIQQLLTRGYHVRGTLRDTAKADALSRALAPDDEARQRLEFVRADLTRDEGWSDALSGVDGVLHTASPVPMRPPRDEAEVIVPAREGTLRVLGAAAEAGVRRVVLTSSIAAIVSGKIHGRGARYSEADWSDLDGKVSAYSKSKTLAERAAWEFQAALPAARRFELATINPAFVIGPNLLGTNNASNEIVRKLLAREVPGVPRIFFPLVDVRDVALAHVLALMSKVAPGERFLTSAHDCWYQDIARILSQGGHRVPTRQVPNWLVHVVSWFDPTARLVLGDLGKSYQLQTDKIRRVLGWHPRPLQETILDTARDLLDRKK